MSLRIRGRRAPATASAAALVAPSRNTDRRMNTSRTSGASRSHEPSSTVRMLR